MAYCSNCGAQLSEGANFCTSCGAAITVSAQSHQPVQQEVQAPAGEQVPIGEQAQQARVEPHQQAQAAPPAPIAPGSGVQNPYENAQHTTQVYSAPTVGDPKFHSLGGWLLFFVILWGLGALSGLGGFFSVLGSLGWLGSVGSGLLAVSIVNLLAIALNTATCVAMVVFICQRSSSFLKIYQVLSIAGIALNVIIAVLSGIAASSSGISVMMTSMSGIVGGVVGLCLVTLYFSRSIRVRTYMGSSEYLDKALFKFASK